MTAGSDRFIRVLACAALAAAALVAAPARGFAQPSGATATATAQFDKGLALMKERKYADACVAFEQSQKLDPQSGTLYNLAICYEQIGKLASAWAAYRELEARDTQAGRRKTAAKRAAALGPRLPRLTISAPSRLPGLVVTLDGADVTGLLGVDNPTDLGDHSIRASAPGHRTIEAVAKVTAEGKTVTIELVLIPEPAAPTAGSGSAPPPPRAATTTAPPEHPNPAASSAAPDRRAGRRRIAMIVGLGGGALVATGLVFGQRARGAWGDLKSVCGDDLRCDSEPDLAVANNLFATAQRRANVSTGLVIAGAAALGVGAVLWITAPRPSQERASARALRLAPTAGNGAAGFVLDGRF